MIIGLTGGIGSGKTTVLHFFKELGAKIFIADIEAKKLMNSNKQLKNEIISLVGNQAYINNELNSGYIASIVFSEKEKLGALNKLVHPVVKQEFKKFKHIHKNNIIIYEAAILFESGSDKDCDYVVTVISGKEDRIERLLKRDVSSRAEIESRMSNQTNDEYKIEKSHFVINNRNLQNTKEQVLTVFKILNALNKKCNIS